MCSQELYVLQLEEWNVLDPMYCSALGRALTALTNLSKIHLDYSHLGSSDEEEIEDSDWDKIAYNVSLLRSLRCASYAQTQCYAFKTPEVARMQSRSAM